MMLKRNGGVQSLELDTVYDEHGSIEKSCEALVEEIPGLTWRVTNPEGPAGGWPVVEWTGTAENLLLMWLMYYDPDCPEGARSKEEAQSIMNDPARLAEIDLEIE